jgi:hypothetical protein
MDTAMTKNPEQAVATLLRAAEREHGVYEQMVLSGIRDESWSTWYAKFLLENGLADVLPGAESVSPQDLAAMLQQFADDYDRETYEVPWPEIYAERLVAGIAKAP